MNNEIISIEYTVHDRNSSTDIQQDTNVTPVVSNPENSTRGASKLSTSNTTPKPLNEIPWSEHRIFPFFCAFAVFTSIAITVGVMTICFTSPTQTNKICELNFIRTAQPANGYDARPHHVAVGDFNNDTYLDIVVANAGIDQIGIFLGYGNGTFASQIIYSTGLGSRPYSLAVGDFNNDILLDIVVANYGINSIGVFLGDGNGHFSSQIITSLGSSHPLSLAVGHFNKDNQLDIAVANYGILNIAILFGSNNGSFRIEMIYDMGYDSIPYSLVIADINKDNRSDIAIVNYGTSELVILLANKNESFVMLKYATGKDSHPCSISVGDFNKDNELDIVLANTDTSNVGVFLGYGNGSFRNLMTYSTGFGSRPQFVVVVDLTNDDKLDVVVIDSGNNNVIVLKGYGNGSFSILTTHSTGYSSDPSAIIIADFDNDNTPDIAITNNNTNTMLILTAFTIYPTTSQTIYSTGMYSYPQCVAVGDFNNDHHLDIVVANSGTSEIGIFIGAGDGTFSSQKTFFITWSAQPQFVAVSDLNNDHNLDVAVAMSGLDAIGIYYGDGNGTLIFADYYYIGYNTQPPSVGIGDFNNDTGLDIVTINSFTGDATVILRNNDGSLLSITTYLTTINSISPFVVVSDLNNDKILDFAVANSWGHAISIYFGCGNGSFYTPMLILVDNNLPQSIAIGDLNNDNRVDIVFASTEPSNVGILFGYGNGTFGKLTVYFTGYGAAAFRVALGDFNNDTHLDIAVVNNQNANIGIFFGYGNETFAPQITFSTGYGSFPYYIATGDFNNDKQADIVVCNTATYNIGVFFVHYDANFLNAISYSFISGPHPYSVAIGNFNNDNQSDIVVTNSGNDNIEILRGYNKGTFTNRTIYSTGAGSHPQHVTVTDLNKDNELDIIVTNYWNDNINVFIGLGNGRFDSAKSYSTGSTSFPNFVIAADFNKDNWTDIVVANQGTDNVGVFLGFNYASFLKQNIYFTDISSIPGSVAVGDFNNDDEWDIVVADSNSHVIRVLLGYGNGSFAEQILYWINASSMPVSIAVRDFNNDSQLDIIFADFGTFSVGLFLGYGNGTFANPMSFSTPTGSPVSLAIGDFNNDTRLDIAVIITIADEIGIFLGYGNGTFVAETSYYMPSGSAPFWGVVGDFNNDYILDVVVANFYGHSIGILLGYGNGTFMDAIMYSTGDNSAPCSITTGYFNKDNWLDIAVSNSGVQNIGIFFGYGNGTFSLQTTHSTGSESVLGFITVFDLNKDTASDIIVTDSGKGNGNIAVFYGLGDGNFAKLKTYSTGWNSAPTSAAFCDFNNDTLIDIVVTQSKNASIGIMLHYRTEPFATQTTFSTGNNSQPTSIAVGHFDNDDHLDIAVANSGNNNIGILLGYGDGYFSEQSIYPTGDNSRPYSLAAGDFNHDNFLDIAVVNSDTNTISILLGYGNGSFYSLTSYSTGIRSDPSYVATDDLNKDTHLDLVISNSGINNVLVFSGLGDGTFFEPKSYSLGFNARPQSVAIGDTNNDNLLDIAVANYGSDYVEILLQTC